MGDETSQTSLDSRSPQLGRGDMIIPASLHAPGTGYCSYSTGRFNRPPVDNPDNVNVKDIRRWRPDIGVAKAHGPSIGRDLP